MGAGSTKWDQTPKPAPLAVSLYIGPERGHPGQSVDGDNMAAEREL